MSLRAFSAKQSGAASFLAAISGCHVFASALREAIRDGVVGRRDCFVARTAPRNDMCRLCPQPPPESLRFRDFRVQSCAASCAQSSELDGGRNNPKTVVVATEERIAPDAKAQRTSLSLLLNEPPRNTHRKICPFLRAHLLDHTGSWRIWYASIPTRCRPCPQASVRAVALGGILADRGGIFDVHVEVAQFCGRLLAAPRPLIAVFAPSRLFPFGFARQTEMQSGGQFGSMRLVQPVAIRNRVQPADLHHRVIPFVLIPLLGPRGRCQFAPFVSFHSFPS